jgi:ubiquinone/menaquinone biosynthesis C-methylase UbiE
MAILSLGRQQLLRPARRLPRTPLLLGAGVLALAGAWLYLRRRAQPMGPRAGRDPKTWVIDVYRARARRYDSNARLFYLVGLAHWAYRRQAVDSLHMQPGDTVVEVGCGTGLNLPLLEEAVGPRGKIIGVDITDAMLEVAQQRVAENGWSNVELVHNDAAAFQFPAGLDGILSTFALTLVPEYDQVIQNGCQALKPGGRWVILDFKLPEGPSAWLAPLLSVPFRPYGVSLDLAVRHPWESFRRRLRNVSLTHLWAGFAYIAAGER